MNKQLEEMEPDAFVGQLIAIGMLDAIQIKESPKEYLELLRRLRAEGDARAEASAMMEQNRKGKSLRQMTLFDAGNRIIHAMDQAAKGKE
jgi:hypothetical protein